NKTDRTTPCNRSDFRATWEFFPARPRRRSPSRFLCRQGLVARMARFFGSRFRVLASAREGSMTRVAIAIVTASYLLAPSTALAGDAAVDLLPKLLDRLLAPPRQPPRAPGQGPRRRRRRRPPAEAPRSSRGPPRPAAGADGPGAAGDPARHSRPIPAR